jgi:N-methylhydantoinase A
LRIAIDTGGTFTDCVYLNASGLQVLKIASTPADPGDAIMRAVSQIAAAETSGEVRHGTTVGTNALLERKGARVAFVTTKGFEDTIAIGRQARNKLYDLFFQKPEPLAPADLRFGVNERTAADGSILIAADAKEIASLKSAVAAMAPESVAVSLLFGFANPANERAVCEALAELGCPVSASHQILPEFREYERGSTVLINAYLAPKMQTYLQHLDTRLQARGMSLQVMQSSGGIVPASLAAREPVRTILSGPAGGVVGARAVAQEAGFNRVLTFDMGGTSTDVALVDCDAGLQTTTESQIEGMPVAIPVLSIHTVGAGGGSLASFDRGGALKVGPESAGAVPGPICYGRGEQPTVTDANLALGRLDANGFLGGGMKLDVERTRQAMERTRQSLPSVEVFAEGIIALANSHMAQALRKISVEQGHDPRDFVLLSFGGAGPLHACELARALRIPKVLVPNLPGALSAYGILLSDVVRDYSRTVMLSPTDSAIEKHFIDLEANADFKAVPERSVDVRYAGQGYELRLPYNADFVNQFHALHKRKYGYADVERNVEVVNVRLRMIEAGEQLKSPRTVSRPGDASAALIREDRIFCDGAWRPSKVYNRAQLRAGDSFNGPAVVVEYSATTYLPPDCSATVDDLLNLVIEVEATT